MSSRPIATWSIELYVECPKCEECVDLTTWGDFWSDRDHKTFGPAIAIEKFEAFCPKCEHEFLCDLVY